MALEVLVESTTWSAAGLLGGYVLGWIARDLHEVREKVDRVAERRHPPEPTVEPAPAGHPAPRHLALTITPDWSDPRWDRRKHLP